MICIFLTKPAVRIQNNLPRNLATFSETPHCSQDNQYAHVRAFQVVRETWWNHVFMKQPFHQGKPYNYKTQQATCLHVVVLGNRQRLKRAPKGERKQDAAKSVAGIEHKHINNFISTQVGSPRIGVFVSKNRRSAHFKRNTVSTSKEIECPLQKRHIKMPSFCFYDLIYCRCGLLM